MSRSRRNPRKHRKVIRNKYLQKILRIWHDDFGVTRGKNKQLNGLVRAREKENLKKEVGEWK